MGLFNHAVGSLQTRFYMKRFVLFVALSLSGLAVDNGAAVAADDEAAKVLQSYAKDAKLEEGEAALAKMLKANPKDQSARACLGIMQFLRAIEGLSQDYYRFGFGPESRAFYSFGRLAIPENPTPEEVSYEQVRSALTRFHDRLKVCDQTLAEFVPSDIKLPIDVLKLQLDIDKNGQPSRAEGFVTVLFATMMGRDAGLAQLPNEVVFAFDDADVFWLRGYTHVMSSLVNIALAYDWRDAFERVGHLVFAKPKTPYPFLLEEQSEDNWSSNKIVDLIAMIHVTNFEVVEPSRMVEAHRDLIQVVELSRLTWKHIQLEKDNDREWLPGEKQTSIVMGGQAGGAMGSNWELMLRRVESVLEGRELLPFWRGTKDVDAFMLLNGRARFEPHPNIGVNLKKVFLEPKRFDLVLWLQGTGVTPFLEKGPIIDSQAWSDTIRLFDGRLPFMALWIN